MNELITRAGECEREAVRLRLLLRDAANPDLPEAQRRESRTEARRLALSLGSVCYGLHSLLCEAEGREQSRADASPQSPPVPGRDAEGPDPLPGSARAAAAGYAKLDGALRAQRDAACSPLGARGVVA